MWINIEMGTDSLPKRHYTKGTRKLVGFRLPDELKKQIESLAKELGWTITDVAQTALDSYIHGVLSKMEIQKAEDKKTTVKGNKK